MPQNADVGARLRALRLMHGLSQRELAKRAGTQVKSQGGTMAIGVGLLMDAKVALVKPKTFVNLSGKAVAQAHAAATVKMPTPVLTRLLHDAVAHQQPRREGRFRPKMRYAHQGGMNPPIVVIHGNSLEHVSAAYRRYLEARFREHFKLVGTPLRVELRSSRNPFDDKGR